ncbi:pilus protein, partial [Shigella dysenteriae]
STLKSPSYTKSVSWQHYRTYNNCNCYIVSGKRLAKIKNDA